MGCLIIVIIALVLIFGSPLDHASAWFWPDSAAPWEEVDAFYYPNANNLDNVITNEGVGGLEDCRNWIIGIAASRNDPTLKRGDYECGVGFVESKYGLRVYRITTR